MYFNNSTTALHDECMKNSDLSVLSGQSVQQLGKFAGTSPPLL
jgi:hypothetical protein